MSNMLVVDRQCALSQFQLNYYIILLFILSTYDIDLTFSVAHIIYNLNAFFPRIYLIKSTVCCLLWLLPS